MSQRSPETTSREARRPEFPQQAVDDAIEVLRAFWDEGNKIREDHGDRRTDGNSSEESRKARAFAGVYSEQEFEDLLQLCRAHKFAIGVSHAKRLATVNPGNRCDPQRTQLAEECVAGRWSRRTLDGEIRRRFGNRKKADVGRRPQCPESGEEALATIVEMMTRLTRFAEVLGWDGDSKKFSLPPKVGPGFPKSVSAAFCFVVIEAEELQRLAEKQLEKKRSKVERDGA